METSIKSEIDAVFGLNREKLSKASVETLIVAQNCLGFLAGPISFKDWPATLEQIVLTPYFHLTYIESIFSLVCLVHIDSLLKIENFSTIRKQT